LARATLLAFLTTSPIRSSSDFDTSTGAALATFPTSSSACIIFLIRAVENFVSLRGGILGSSHRHRNSLSQTQAGWTLELLSVAKNEPEPLLVVGRIYFSVQPLRAVQYNVW